MLINNEETSPDEGPERIKEFNREYFLTIVPRDRLLSALDVLMPREKRIVEMHLGLADGKFYTYEEIAEEFNITRERVRRIEARALRGFLCRVNLRAIRKFKD